MKKFVYIETNKIVFQIDVEFLMDGMTYTIIFSNVHTALTRACYTMLVRKLLDLKVVSAALSNSQ